MNGSPAGGEAGVGGAYCLTLTSDQVCWVMVESPQDNKAPTVHLATPHFNQVSSGGAVGVAPAPHCTPLCAGWRTRAAKICDPQPASAGCCARSVGSSPVTGVSEWEAGEGSRPPGRWRRDRTFRCGRSLFQVLSGDRMSPLFETPVCHLTGEQPAGLCG